MGTRTRYIRHAAAMTLVLGLAACDKQPFENSTASTGENPEFARQKVRQATFGNLIAALNNIALQINRLNALNDLTIGDVTVVNVEDVLNGNNIQAFNSALDDNEIEITVLQNFLNNSLNNNNVNIIRDALNNVNVAIGQVVGISVLSGGNVFVFFQD